MPKAKYKRVLLKLSGEAMAGKNGFGIDVDTLATVCDYIKKIVDMGVEVAIVVGGGNFWRGRQAHHMERTTADYMGMLATIMNGQALQEALEYRGLDTRLQTSLEIKQIAEPYIRRKAVRHLEKGRVVIFAGGTGNPFFSTDTCAALRASEINAEIILFGKTIDVIDSTAASLCRDNHIPIMIFALHDAEDIVRAVSGEEIGTMIDE